MIVVIRLFTTDIIFIFEQNQNINADTKLDW